MTLLYLVRHGHTVLSDSGEIAGFTDVSLSGTGKQAVSELAKGMPQQTADVYYSSDLRRAVQTLELLGSTDKAIQDRRLRELNFGEWEGLTWEQVHNRDASYLKKWSDNWLELSPPSGETFIELAERTNDWYRELLATTSYSSDDSSIMVVAHAGSIRALLCNLLEIPLDCAFRFSIDYARATIFKISSQGHHQCLAVNSPTF